MRAYGTLFHSISQAYAIWLVFKRMWILWFLSGVDDITTINHIYCPYFHFQLILVEVIMFVNERTNDALKLKLCFFYCNCQFCQVFQFYSCAQFFFIERGFMSIPYVIRFYLINFQHHNTKWTQSSNAFATHSLTHQR